MFRFPPVLSLLGYRLIGRWREAGWAYAHTALAQNLAACSQCNRNAYWQDTLERSWLVGHTRKNISFLRVIFTRYSVLT